MYRQDGKLRKDVLPRVVWMINNGIPADLSPPVDSNGGGSPPEPLPELSMDMDGFSVPSAWMTPEAMNHDGYQVSGKKRIPRLGKQIHQHIITLEDQTYKWAQLNPRWVETLMGLPVGWTMPSCARPWTIAQTNSDPLEMVLIQM
jgi:hypothetical protein